MGLINPLDQGTQPNRTVLRNAQNAGVTDYFIANGTGRDWTYNGSKGRIQTTGEFGSTTPGTLTLETSQDGGTTYEVDPIFSMTAPSAENIDADVPRGIKWRFVLAGAVGTVDLSIFVLQGRGT